MHPTGSKWYQYVFSYTVEILPQPRGSGDQDGGQ